MPLVVGSIAIVVGLGERLLPSRTAQRIGLDFSGHARRLVEQYELEHRADELVTRRSGVAEVVIPPRSELAGSCVFPGMVTDSGDLVVLAVQRAGEALGPGETELAEGDVLLLRGTWAALDEQLEDPAVLVVDPPALIRRQAVPLGLGAKRALAVLAGMVALLASPPSPS
jgi:di/tricarboxylate transporter